MEKYYKAYFQTLQMYALPCTYAFLCNQQLKLCFFTLLLSHSYITKSRTYPYHHYSGISVLWIVYPQVPRALPFLCITLRRLPFITHASDAARKYLRLCLWDRLCMCVGMTNFNLIRLPNLNVCRNIQTHVKMRISMHLVNDILLLTCKQIKVHM